MKVVAVDLGASGGRVLTATFSGADAACRLEVEETHRFPHGPLALPQDNGETLHWNVFQLWSEILDGLRHVGAAHGRPDSIGVDTWGDDFALIDQDGRLLGCPVCYRDRRAEGMIERACGRMSRENIFRRTGMQFMTPNALYHLMGMVAHRSPLLRGADRFLMMPDLFHYWLCGSKTGEYTNASITQMLDATTRQWDRKLLDRLGVPHHFLPELNEPGAHLGTLRPSVADETGLPADVPVICPATHDTAAAVAATPGQGQDWAFLSAGTWCLFGAEVDRPYLDPSVLRAGFGNEGGVRGTIRLLRNITGLWLVQECRRQWSREGHEYSYVELTQRAADAPPFLAMVDPDAPAYAQPTRMAHAIAEYCSRTEQPVPGTPGEFVRCCLESIALTVRLRWEQLHGILGRRLSVLHMVGGGVQNTLLCQFIANAIGVPVVAGPVEATAMGNALIQGIGLGALDYDAAREITRRSTVLVEYTPQETAAWDDHYARFLERRGG